MNTHTVKSLRILKRTTATFSDQSNLQHLNSSNAFQHFHRFFKMLEHVLAIGGIYIQQFSMSGQCGLYHFLAYLIVLILLSQNCQIQTINFIYSFARIIQLCTLSATAVKSTIILHLPSHDLHNRSSLLLILQQLNKLKIANNSVTIYYFAKNLQQHIRAYTVLCGYDTNENSPTK